MNRTCISEQTVTEDDAETLLYRYYLLSELLPDGSAENYGIEVELEQGKSHDCCAVCGLTPIASRVLQLLGELSRYKVSPFHLRDVLEDIL